MSQLCLVITSIYPSIHQPPFNPPFLLDSPPMIPDCQRLQILLDLAEEDVIRYQVRANYVSEGVWTRARDRTGIRARADAVAGLPPVNYGPLVWTKPIKPLRVDYTSASSSDSSTPSSFSSSSSDSSDWSSDSSTAETEFLAFPAEVQRLIVSCVAQKELAVFARCSFQCLEMALPVLYRELRIKTSRLHAMLQGGVGLISLDATSLGCLIDCRAE